MMGYRRAGEGSSSVCGTWGEKEGTKGRWCGRENKGVDRVRVKGRRRAEKGSYLGGVRGNGRKGRKGSGEEGDVKGGWSGA